MYQYKGCGLNNIYLVNGYVEKETNYGNAVSVSKLKELHNVIGFTIITSSKAITGKEIRFLRKDLDLSIVDLSVLTMISTSYIEEIEKMDSIVENDKKLVSLINIIKLLYLNKVKNSMSYKAKIDLLFKRKRDTKNKLYFELDKETKKWILKNSVESLNQEGLNV